MTEQTETPNKKKTKAIRITFSMLVIALILFLAVWAARLVRTALN